VLQYARGSQSIATGLRPRDDESAGACGMVVGGSVTYTLPVIARRTTVRPGNPLHAMVAIGYCSTLVVHSRSPRAYALAMKRGPEQTLKN
jgi:hypothetical protein